MALNYIKPSKVQSFMKAHGLRVSRKYMEVLDREVAILMERHRRTAVADRRKTVLPIDIELSGVVASLSRGIRR